MTVGAGENADLGTEPARPGMVARVLDVFRDPVRTFLVLAIVLGGYLAGVVPHFAGVDEPAHFYRSYQISTGQFVPERYPGLEFSGAWIPIDVIRARQRDSRDFLEHQVSRIKGYKLTYDPEKVTRCNADRTECFVTFSTFGAPLPYLPQAAAIFVTRSLGAGTDTMLVAARLALLLAYVAVVTVAIRRTPRSKWAFCAVGLLPLAVFQSSASVSHDALTIAVSLVVVSSALRTMDAPPGATRTSLFVEAALLTTLLASCKPGYAVLAGCYLLPLFGPRRRRELWPLALAPVLGALVSVVWNSAISDLWKTDAALFGVHVDPARQRHLLVTEPWTFVGAALRTVVDDSWQWAKQLVTTGPSVAVWPTVAVVAVLVVLSAASVQRSRQEPDGLAWSQRLVLAIVFVAGSLLVLGAQYVYWSAPGDDVVGGMRARFFVPLLVLLPILVGPAPWRWARAATARVPVALAVVPIYVAFAITIAYRMY